MTHLDERSVLKLYKSFASDVIEAIKQRVDQLKICYYPATEESLIKEWLGDAFECEPQSGRHLGERMKQAFRNTFSEGYEKAILVGTDIPELSEAVIDEAFLRMDQGMTVIGPARDGGYYLIGFRRDRFVDRVFDDIPWGTRRVFDDTLATFDQLNCSVHVLPQCLDIDTYEDLMDLSVSLRKRDGRAKNTTACLRSLGLM
jgi:rSAM/selenodomain-associated transferase 1